jgi:hypothetical protein
VDVFWKITEKDVVKVCIRKNDCDSCEPLTPACPQPPLEVGLAFGVAFGGCNVSAVGNGIVTLNGVGIAGIPVTFTVTSGSATVSPLAVFTGTGGLFSTNITPTGTGSITITITALIDVLPPISQNFTFASPCL